MSLDRFMKSRLVVQSPGTRIYDAVRAMEDNGIGSVLVHDGEGLAGIITDRDLALKVVGEDLDAFEFVLQDIMSSPVATVPAGGTVADVANIMLNRHVRRVPIMDGGTILGMVTLDDLLLEHALDASTLAAIVRGQLAQPARLKPKGKLHPAAPGPHGSKAAPQNADRRQQARRRQVYGRLIKRTMAWTEIESTELAEKALLIVITALVRRLTPHEAGDFLAQLPRSLHDYAIANVPAGPDVGVTRQDVEDQVAHALGVGPDGASRTVRQIGSALRSSISEGELNDVKSQLPADMKAIFDMDIDSIESMH